MRLRLVRHPSRLNARHPILIEEMLELTENGSWTAVGTLIEMLDDLHRHGQQSRFFRNFKGLTISELKSASRGGSKGGSRVYFWVNPQDEAMVVNCEVKQESSASMNKLRVVLEVRSAYEQGIAVWRDPRGK